MKYKKIVIIGMGLIGGSIGKALIEKGLAEEVVGICRRQSSLDRAVKEKSLTRGYVNNHAEAVEGADIIFIATPVHTIKDMLDILTETVKDNKTLVTDVGSTKKEIVEYASQYKDKFHFIGAHPLAGLEKAGVEYSDADLFEGSVCILTPTADTHKEDTQKLQNFWESTGATVVVMGPEEHDRNLAFSSHLPHVVAYALAGTLEQQIPKAMYATGFKDTTRIASSDASLWSDILLSNRENILESIKKFQEILTDVEKDIDSGNIEGLKKKLDKYRSLRDDIL